MVLILVIVMVKSHSANVLLNNIHVPGLLVGLGDTRVNKIESNP